MKIKIIEAKLEEKELEHILLFNNELSENAKTIVTSLLNLVKMNQSLDLENKQELLSCFQRMGIDAEMKEFMEQVLNEGTFKIPVYVE